MAVLKKFRKSFLIIFIAGISLIPVGYATDTNYFEVTKNLEIFYAVVKNLVMYYVDDIQPSKLLRKGIDEMLKSLDPYTQYVSEADIEDYELETTGKYGGIGAIISKRDEYVIIAEPYEGFAADKAGLRAGDKILEIDGQSVKGKSTEEVSKFLKGSPGTEVKVKLSRLQPDGTEKVFEVNIVREEVKINNIPYYGMINETTGYIYLANFRENAGKELRNAVQELKKNENLQSIILDLRGNPGGLLNESVIIVNVFVDKGETVVTTKGRIPEWYKVFKTLNPPIDTEIPLAVLTNSGSASASEIVSGAIQDLDRGVIIGQKTFGKGLVQSYKNLPYNTKLKLTVAKYYTPSGRCIQAIDYSNRAEDGSVGSIPDSLKNAFRTRNGRIVYDGGGIDPDIPVKRTPYHKITQSLLSKNLIFDYATIYRAKHEKIPPPDEFQLSDDDFEDFVAYISDKDYDYTTETEELIEDLEKTSKKEKYYDNLKDEIDDLRTRVYHNKEKDIYTNKDEIKELLEREIAGRYYYRKGMIQATFDDDPEINKALEVLSNRKMYESLLTPEGQMQAKKEAETIEEE